MSYLAGEADQPLVHFLLVCTGSLVLGQGEILGKDIAERLPAEFMLELHIHAQSHKRFVLPIAEILVVFDESGEIIGDELFIAAVADQRGNAADLIIDIKSEEIDGYFAGAGESPVWVLMIMAQLMIQSPLTGEQFIFIDEYFILV